jgi:hypothetical protein
MKLEDLPEEMQEAIKALEHGSNTIEVDITDALEDAKNLSEFKETVRIRMKDLIGEAQGAIADFCGDPAVNDALQISELSKTLESIRELYTALYNIDHRPEDFATEFFYMVGELLNGKKLSELRPAEPAAGTLRMMLENKNRIPDESKKSKGV